MNKEFNPNKGRSIGGDFGRKIVNVNVVTFKKK